MGHPASECPGVQINWDNYSTQEVASRAGINWRATNGCPILDNLAGQNPSIVADVRPAFRASDKPIASEEPTRQRRDNPLGLAYSDSWPAH